MKQTENKQQFSFAQKEAKREESKMAFTCYKYFLCCLSSNSKVPIKCSTYSDEVYVQIIFLVKRLHVFPKRCQGRLKLR